MAQSHPTRQKFLETSKELEELHTLAARKGSTDVPEPDGEVEHHYVCFVVAEGRIWELDGDMEGEIDRGEVKGEGQDGDVLSGGGVDAVRNYLEKKTEGTFSLMAVVEEKE